MHAFLLESWQTAAFKGSGIQISGFKPGFWKLHKAVAVYNYYFVEAVTCD